MCVIVIVQDERPDAEIIEKCFNHNRDGGGIAWNEKDKNGTGIVRWAKGLDLATMQDLTTKLPLPYVAHFRIETCGGKTPKLCHPFPISREVSVALEGTTKGSVLFHNGHWGAWRNEVYTVASRAGLKLPGDKWSDTRALAWMTAHLGSGVPEMLNEKTVLFSPRGVTDITGTGWFYRGKIWYSNENWNHGGVHSSWSPTTGRRHGVSDGRTSPTDSIFTTPPASLPGKQVERANGDATSDERPHGIDPRVTSAAANRNRSQAGGTDVTKIPFLQVKWMYENKEGSITRKQFKRARRAFLKYVKTVEKTDLLRGVALRRAAEESKPLLIH